jgi:phosphoglycolate phosphatase-like HAD superfamily hydrolase
MRQLKPHPDGWRVICEIATTTRGLGGDLEAPQAVVVGDSWVDGAAAGAAGVPFIAYRTNPRDLERWNVTPVAILEHLGHLPALLTKLRESG